MPHYLAIEAGATHSKFGLYDHQLNLVQECQGPPASTSEYNVSHCARTIAQAAQPLLTDNPQDLTVLLAIAGAHNPDDKAALGQQLCTLLNTHECIVSSDVHTLFYANRGEEPAILAIAGTGSSIVAGDDKKVLQVGGRGKYLGDDGSAYGLARMALRAVTTTFDGWGPETTLLEALPKAAGLETFYHFVDWHDHASKAEVAALAQCIIQEAESGDVVAQALVQAQAEFLVKQIFAAHHRIGKPERGTVVLYGGLVENAQPFQDAVVQLLQQQLNWDVALADYKGHLAALQLLHVPCDFLNVIRVTPEDHSNTQDTTQRQTEKKAQLENTIDRMSASELVTTMIQEESAVQEALQEVQPAITALVECATTTIQEGHCIFYIGAGTSGRLGVLDASECPPTFGVTSERVIGIMAGGEMALRNSVEGAEDDGEQGVADFMAHSPQPGDLLVGIAASGTTPYVLAALDHAAQHNITTALITCNPDCDASVDHPIHLNTGPEVLTGSTRLKAGTATKLILNMITTGAMAHAGYVYNGLMVGMVSKNEKLRHRAARIVTELSPLDQEQAADLLQRTSYHIGLALIMANKNCSLPEAQSLLDQHQGILTKILD